MYMNTNRIQMYVTVSKISAISISGDKCFRKIKRRSNLTVFGQDTDYNDLNELFI